MEVDKLSFNEGLAAKLQNLTQQGSKIIAALIHGNHVFDVQTLKPPKTVFDLTNGFKSTLRNLEVYDSDVDRCLGPEDCKQDIYYIRGLPTETGQGNANLQGSAQIVESIARLSEDMNALTLEIAERKTAISLAHSDASLSHLREIGSRINIKVLLSRVVPSNPNAPLAKKPNYSLGCTLESDMMGGAGRWLNMQLKGTRPVQKLQAYPVPNIDFLNYVFPEQLRVKIHGRTDFLIGVKIIIDQLLLDEGKTQLDLNLCLRALPWLFGLYELERPHEARASGSIAQAGQECLAVSYQSELWHRNLWQPKVYFGDINRSAEWQYKKHKNSIVEAAYRDVSQFAYHLRRDVAAFEEDILPKLPDLMQGSTDDDGELGHETGSEEGNGNEENNDDNLEGGDEFGEDGDDPMDGYDAGTTNMGQSYPANLPLQPHVDKLHRAMQKRPYLQSQLLLPLEKENVEPGRSVQDWLTTQSLNVSEARPREAFGFLSLGTSPASTPKVAKGSQSARAYSL